MPQSLYVIDSRVTDYQTLIANLPAGSKWYLLDAEEDGVAQIASLLTDYQGLDALHILSHGSSGTLYLGTTALSTATLRQYQTQLSAIGSSLTATGDILLYGCNVGAGETAPKLDDQIDKTAAGIIAEAAKQGVKGADEFTKGLLKLFGGRAEQRGERRRGARHNALPEPEGRAAMGNQAKP